jgi:uncharacterized Fe-S radical SAM superfamily protein PflX
VTEPRLSLFSFALETEAATEALLQRINDDGRIYLTQTRVDGRFAIRVQVGSFDCCRRRCHADRKDSSRNACNMFLKALAAAVLLAAPAV